MEITSKFQDMRENTSPLNSPGSSNNNNSNGMICSSSSNMLGGNTGSINGGGGCSSVGGNPIQSPIPITRSDPNHPYPTTFVTADTSSFKQVVQLLTGSTETSKNLPKPQQQQQHQHQQRHQHHQQQQQSLPSPRNHHQQQQQSLPSPRNHHHQNNNHHDQHQYHQHHHHQNQPPQDHQNNTNYPPHPSSSSSSKNYIIPPIKTAGPKKPGFKLYERRNSLKNSLMNISPLNSNFTKTTSFSPRKPEILSPSLLDFPSLTLSSPVTPLSSDPFDKSSIGNCSSSSEEERAIAEKGYYLHPSPMSTPRESEPQLLPLFPVTSPRVSKSSSTS